MADVRDIMGSRLKQGYRRFLGHLSNPNESSNMEKVQGFMKGTLTWKVINSPGGGGNSVIVDPQASQNGKDWFSMTIDGGIDTEGDGSGSFPYEGDYCFVRLVWLSGGGGSTQIRDIEIKVRHT